jgi:acetylornithine deacetylase
MPLLQRTQSFSYGEKRMASPEIRRPLVNIGFDQRRRSRMDISSPTRSDATVPADERRLVDAAHGLKEEAVALLAELVREPSLLGDEAGAQAVMSRAYRGLGLAVREFAIDEETLRSHAGWSPSIVSYEGRNNVVGTHTPEGPATGRSLILNGHIDVVPVGAQALWKHPPFSAHIDGDRLYGRGAADMKAGIVAFTMAFEALRRLGLEPAATVHLQSVVEEECTGNGALACLVEGYRADAAVIPEPVGGLLTCQMGVMWISIETLGKPVHASVAHTGVGAIGFAMDLFAALQELERKWNEPKSRHGYFLKHEHPVNFNLGRIQGGEWASSVPTQCRADIRLGFYPDMPAERVRAEIERVLAQAHARHPNRDSLEYRVTYQGFQAEGCIVDENEPVLGALAAAHRDVAGRALERVALTATTDARFFNIYGAIPATCYGPSGSSIHGIDEWVSIDSMMETTAVLAVFIARWCGVNRIPGTDGA